MNIIVTVDEAWSIGRGAGQLVQIPAATRQLQQITAGKTVVMGRKTLEAMPQGQPLYGRENLVLSTKSNLKVKGITVVPSIEAFLEEMEKRKANGRNLEDVFVCGGDSIYEQLLPYCDTVYVTFLEKLYDADRRFQNLDKSSEWQLLEESDEQSYFDITYYFRKYGRHLKN